MFKAISPCTVFIALALFALPAMAQSENASTICDGTDYRDATPGLKGLCVAMCEAQDCEASYDPELDEFTFNDSCKPSTDVIMANYNKIRDRDMTDNDPEMPCVRVVCPCWSEDEIDNVGDNLGPPESGDTCNVFPAPSPATLMGSSPETGQTELARASSKKCAFRETTADGSDTRVRDNISTLQAATCRKSVIEECVSRGLYSQ